MTAVSPLKHLAYSAAQWHERPLTPDLQQAARNAVLDWFATMLAGCVHPPATILAKAFEAEGGHGRALCYVTGGTMAPIKAQLINVPDIHIVDIHHILHY